MEKKCNNCAWYCHSNQACYGTPERMNAETDSYEYRDARSEACTLWTFDCLEDWEREEYKA